MKRKIVLAMAASMLAANLAACGSKTATETTQAPEITEAVKEETSVPDSDKNKEKYENSEDGGHAIHADGGKADYENIEVQKTGDSSSEEADFYGDNAAIFAENGATLTIKNADITTDGSHANAVFSYGEGTTVNISDSKIRTNSNNSGGLMTTGGGTMNAENLDVITQGGSSAAIRSDRGGGTVNVTGGYYEANGKGSPAVYSTADITVKDAELVSNSAQGIVVEGKNSVTLENVTLTANNVTKNSDKSSVYQAVMLYQSMSGDADEGTASFVMKGGSLVNKNGGMFYINNTKAEIDIDNVDFTYASDDFLRIEAAGWGKEGANGGQVTFTAANQEFEGNTIVDSISTLNMYLNDGTLYSGSINTDGEAGAVYVEISDDSTWKLTGDSYITSLTCDEDAIDLNGFKLYVNGEAYTEGTESKGEAVEAYKSDAASQDMGQKPEDGKGGPQDGQAPNGKPGDGQGQAPENAGDGQQPPEKPEGDQGNGMGQGGAPEGMPGGGMTPPDGGNGQQPPEMPTESAAN